MTVVHTSKAQDEVADQFLQALIDETNPGFEPEETAEWAEAFLRSIRRFREVGNFRHSREAERAAERLGRQASADIYRFFWEFWQNADDAGATDVVFTIDDDYLVITNNGRPFDSREIYSLIFVASTTKAARPDLMGQFGVGSLSLMRFTKAPTYVSGNYAFNLERSFTYPAPIQAAHPAFRAGTRVIVPLSPEFDRDQIFSDLAERVESETLLYMKNLSRVTVRDRRSGEEKEAVIDVRRRGDGHVVKLGDREWLRFTRRVMPPPGARRDDGTEVCEPLTITLVRERDENGPHPVCAYFPTQQYHSYPWRFSAPFDVTTGRENLIRSDFNRWLLCETGRTMLHAAIARGVGSRSDPWQLVPLEGHADGLLDEVWQGARAEMKATAWLPTRAGLVKPTEAVFAETAEVRSLVGRTDLLDLSEGKRNWVRGMPTAMARPVLKDLGAMRVCCHTLSRILEKGPPSRKSDWYLRALSSVIQLYPETGGDEKEEIEARLIGGKCVLERGSRKTRGQPTSLALVGQSGRVVCNTRSEVLARELGRLFPDRMVTVLHRVYRLPDRTTNDPTDDMRRRVDEWFRRVSSDTTFRYATRFDASAFIRTFVEEGPRPDNPEDVSDDILSFVRDHLESYASDQEPNRRDETLRQLGRSLLVKAHTVDADGKRITEYKPASEIHIPAGYFDKPTWAKAARGVPGLWWADWRYRKTLVRLERQMSVVAFLRALGAHAGPRIEPIGANASHNVYSFARVTRGDSVRFPNFPHGSVAFDEYSDYGLVGDSESSDLAVWLRYVASLGQTERSLRGEALLRTFEEQWQAYADKSRARATGYYFNAEYPLGDVPSKWIWELRQSDWVAGSQGFAKPESMYASTEETLVLLDPEKDALCRWSCRLPDAARALGFKTDVPPSKVISELRDARSSGGVLPSRRAAAYYEHLSRADVGLAMAKSTFGEGLILAPGRRQNWWRPDECLRDDQRSVFGDFCGYLDSYSTAQDLWDTLQVAPTANLEFLVQFWKRVSVATSPEEENLNRVLRETYHLAEKLLGNPDVASTAVTVLAGGDWRESSVAFVTSYEELAEKLRSNGLYRWDYELPELMPRFQRWAGILHVERDAAVKVVSSNTSVDTELEEKLHAGIHSFAAEVSRIGGDLWPAVRGRARSILEGRVQRGDPLRLQLSFDHPKGGAIDCEVAVPAFCQDGNVFVSGLTTLSDQSLADALLSGLPLGGQARWNAINLLRLHLMIGHPSVGEPLDLFDEEEQSFDPSDIWSQTGEQGDNDTEGAQIDPTRNTPPRPKPPAPPVHPVDAYEVESDEGGEEPSEPEGGLVGRRKVRLRRPRKTKGSRGGGGADADMHTRKSTEERAVDLFRMYVLEPDGIEITDQRLRARVGADLVGNDNVFRELKARSGSAADKVELTSHEYVRAGQAREAYELVIVEHVWDDPVITVIRDPLGRLEYYPVGDIVVEGWRELDPRPRIVRMTKTEAES